MNWSKEQLAAIESVGTNELLNAGAGSGKTAVLSEHVIYLLEHGYKLNQLLIMTFTNAAANEMKQRIKQKIEDKPELNAKYGDEIESAQITTFDAFYLYLVKKYYYVLGINPNISIMNASIEEVSKNNYINEVLESYYGSDDPKFKKLIKAYCIKDDKIISNAISNVLAFADLSFDKENFFNHYNDEFYSEAFINKCIDEKFKRLKQDLKLLYEACDKFQDEKTTEILQEFFSSFDKCQTYDELVYSVAHNPWPKFISKVKEDRPWRADIKKHYDETFVNQLANSGTIKDIINTQIASKDYAEVIFKMAHEAYQRLQAFKHKNNAYSFSDITSYAIKLIQIENIQSELKNQFRYILVDEYQDTNNIQEMFINKIEDNNVFMVGDVKQSIYRFRNANCLIFQNKYNAYKHFNDGGHVIDMTNNFRSRRELVQDFNLYFTQLMRKDNNLIDYNDGHVTNFGFKDYEKADFEGRQKGIMFYKYFDEDRKGEDYKYTNAEYEARIIVTDIIKKINNGYQVYDKTSPTLLRPCTFKDFAIIIDRGTQFDNYQNIFNEFNVPLYVFNDDPILEHDFVMIAPNLLKLFVGVKNHNYDSDFIHAYCSLARSFIFEKSDEEIFKTVKNESFDSDDLIIKVRNVVKMHENESIYNIFVGFIDEFDIYGTIERHGDYNKVNADINNILEIADQLDSFGYSNEDAISYFEDLKENKIEIKMPNIQDSENSVILLNIHKSKGLEFPIVYYPGYYSRFKSASDKTNFLVTSKYGLLCPPEINGFEQMNRSLYFEDEQAEDYQEKLRVLYVAMTRAKELAIVVDIFDSDKDDVIKPVDQNNFHKIMHPIRIANDKIYQVPVNEFNVSLNESSNVFDKTKALKIYDQPNIEYQVIEKSRASKTASIDASDDALEFGNKMHLLLELVDIETKDLSYIENDKEKRYVKNVIDMDIFKGVDNEHIRHEFAFYDKSNNLLGIIDCMLIKDEEIDIIDFKLKNIDDEAYLKQLKAYKDYIKTITSKKIRTFLISIIDADIKEVEVDE